MQIKISFVKDPLILPKRYELLERTARQQGAEITKIVRKIESANQHIQNLLGQISVGSIGQFQLFFGESGSGKTTFLRTLPNFFNNIKIFSFPENITLAQIIIEIENQAHVKEKKIFVIDERDNPTIDEKELKIFFEKLRVLFRKPGGDVLVIWPITNEESCEKISTIAWNIGKESISPSTGPKYIFLGLLKDQYFEVADETIRNLNNGESIDSYGISKELTQNFLSQCTTIGAFYSRIEELAYKINESKWKILEEKVKPKVWILLPGDSISEINMTVKSLTQGIEGKVDIDRICAYLDDQENESTYLNDWRSRRSDAGFLFRFLDVRLFGISPNLALSAIRAFGTSKSKTPLKKKSENQKQGGDLIKRSNFYLALTNESDSSKRSESATKTDTQHEFIRLQQQAKTQDKELNQGIGKAIEYALTEDGYKDFTVVCEKQELTGTNLKPDIMIQLGNKEVVCLELTWRSTGLEIVGEIEGKQNTLTAGHIQKYLLEKVMEYVKELDL